MNRRHALKFGLFGALAAVGGGGFLMLYKHATGVRPISKYPDPVLRVRSKPVERIDAALKTLAHRLVATIRYHSLKGFFTKAAMCRGLAAPQLGVPKRVIVCGIQGELKVLINPRIISGRGRYSGAEFCLSLPGCRPRRVERPGSVELAYLDLDGSRQRLHATGEYAAVLSHEIDHLNGILYIDYAS
jgi:peptide deformylase